MEKHPEGGFFVETYRCPQKSYFEDFSGDRNTSTAIFYLLEEKDFSSFHRIRSDEMWHFYQGGPLKIVEISPQGELIETILGNQFLEGQKIQYVVKAGHWFASYPLEGSRYCFVGCTVAPGFDFQDFELGQRKVLSEQYPQHTQIIHELTRQ